MWKRIDTDYEAFLFFTKGKSNKRVEQGNDTWALTKLLFLILPGLKIYGSNFYGNNIKISLEAKKCQLSNIENTSAFFSINLLNYIILPASYIVFIINKINELACYSWQMYLVWHSREQRLLFDVLLCTEHNNIIR